MFCPVCKLEYRLGFTQCSDCDVPLVEYLTDTNDSSVAGRQVKAGYSVSKGQPLLVLEAMKMEHTLSAPADGKIKSVRYGVGEQVVEGAELIEFDEG